MALILALALLTLAALLCFIALRRRSLQDGTVVYQDTDGRGKPLISPRRPLTGKPDFILRLRGGTLVPVEVKSYRRGAQPPHADLAQLGAYLLLLEDIHGHRPPYGVLRYADGPLRVPYTEALRVEVLRLLAAVQATQNAPAGTPHPHLCRACPFAPICATAHTQADTRAPRAY